MSYTENQIQAVCDKVAETMKDFTVVQNYTFPTTAIINGMKAGKSAQEIADDAYNSICNLPLYQTGFGLVGMGDSMRNVAMHMASAVRQAIEALGAPDMGDEPEMELESESGREEQPDVGMP